MNIEVTEAARPALKMGGRAGGWLGGWEPEGKGGWALFCGQNTSNILGDFLFFLFFLKHVSLGL